MMEEQESQIEAADLLSPPSHQPESCQNNDQESQIDAADLLPPPSHQPESCQNSEQFYEEDEHYSNLTHVEDTQFTGIEGESYPEESLIDDAQLEGEIEEEFEDNVAFSPNTRKLLRSAVSRNDPAPVSAKENENVFKPIQRPSIIDHTGPGFQFKPAVKPPSYSARVLGKVPTPLVWSQAGNVTLPLHTAGRAFGESSALILKQENTAQVTPAVAQTTVKNAAATQISVPAIVTMVPSPIVQKERSVVIPPLGCSNKLNVTRTPANGQLKIDEVAKQPRKVSVASSGGHRKLSVFNASRKKPFTDVEPINYQRRPVVTALQNILAYPNTSNEPTPEKRPSYVAPLLKDYVEEQDRQQGAPSKSLSPVRSGQAITCEIQARNEKKSSDVNEILRHASPSSGPLGRSPPQIGNFGRPTKHAVKGMELYGTPRYHNMSFSNSTKVKKSAVAGRGNYVVGCTRMIEALEDYQGLLQELERQEELIEFQKKEIESLHIADTQSIGHISALEKERCALTRKLEKSHANCKKYAAHMNEVVESQKLLKTDYLKLRGQEFKLRQELEHFVEFAKQSLVEGTAHAAKFQSLKEARVALAAKEESDLRKTVTNLTKMNELLQADLDGRMLELGRERHHADQAQKQIHAQKSAHKELADQIMNSQNSLFDGLFEEGGLFMKLINSESTTQTMVTELTRSVKDLSSREQVNFPALVKLVEESCAKIQNKVSVDNQTGIQTLLDELKRKIDRLQLDEQTKAQLETEITQLRSSSLNLKSTLECRVTECERLSVKNEELASSLQNCQNELALRCEELASLRALSQQSPELRDQIRTLKNANTGLLEELAVADVELSDAKAELSIVKEDLCCEKKELNHVKETTQHLDAEIQKLKEATQISEAEISGLKDELESTRGALNDSRELNKHFVANEVTKARAEVAKDATAKAKDEAMKAKGKLDASEKRLGEATLQLNIVKEELQRVQQDNQFFTNNANKMQAELSSHNKQAMQNAAQIKHLEGQIPSSEELLKTNEKMLDQVNKINHLEAEMTSYKQQTANYAELFKQIESKASSWKDGENEAQILRTTLTVLQNQVTVMRNKTAHDLIAALQGKQDVEGVLRHVDSVQQENESLKAQLLKLHEKYDTPNKFSPLPSQLTQIAPQVQWEFSGAFSNDQFTNSNRRSIWNLGSANSPSEGTSPTHPTPEQALQVEIGRRSAVQIQIPENTLGYSSSQKPESPGNLMMAGHQLMDPNSSKATPRPNGRRVANRKPSNLSKQITAGSVYVRTESTKYSTTRTTHRIQDRAGGSQASEPVAARRTRISAVEPSNLSSPMSSIKIDVADTIPVEVNNLTTKDQEGTNHFDLMRNTVSSSYEFSGGSDDVTGVNQKDVSTCLRRSSEVLTKKKIPSIPNPILKSAMKKYHSASARTAVSSAGGIGKGVNSPQDNTPKYGHPSSSQAPRSGVKNSVTHPQYNRVAAGQAHAKVMPTASKSIRTHSGRERPVLNASHALHKSPFMSAPARNQKKRKASELHDSDAGKHLAKAPRLSLPPRNLSRTVGPDSQVNPIT